MPNYNYGFLIIGGGMTAAAAVNGIRQVNASASIGIISQENHRPYNRPPLSKGLWKGDPLEKIWTKTPTENVTIHTATLALRMDTGEKTVVDHNGAEYSFGKLLLATGGVVRKLPFDVEGIIYYRTLDDYHRLRALTQQGESFAVIGGGFIGSEIAAALAMNDRRVTMIFPEAGIGGRVYPARLSAFLNSYYKSKGITVLAGENVTRIERHATTYLVTTGSGHTLSVDGVVAGIGILPATELAQAAGLTVNNGIVVDEWLRTSHPDVYAAGDVANFFNPALGKRIRVEHEDNATTMGEIAGKNMAGAMIPYHHLPFFYSDLFDLGYEAVGELDARHEIVEDWKEEFREGVVYYLQQGRVRGVLLWNTWGQVENARALIAEQKPFAPDSLRGRLPA